jgi:hypothetical protein
MKKFNVLIVENTSATIEVEAENAEQAREMVNEKIARGELDGMQMDESEGYHIDDIQEK